MPDRLEIEIIEDKSIDPSKLRPIFNPWKLAIGPAILDTRRVLLVNIDRKSSCEKPTQLVPTHNIIVHHIKSLIYISFARFCKLFR